MLALKKKREAEKKAAEEAAANGDTTAASAPQATVSLLGVGGKKQANKNGDSAATNGKKRTPGEIRIQKGALLPIKWRVPQQQLAPVARSSVPLLK